ncbi:MAG: hypothetical protein ACOYOK_04200 [Pseudobdellovibrionaceae bacterium]
MKQVRLKLLISRNEIYFILKSIKRSVLIGSIFLFCSCNYFSNHVSKEEKSSIIQKAEPSDDFLVPKKLWNLITETSQKSLPKDYIFSEVNLYLKEKNPSVLVKPKFKVVFPRGGGELDLSSYVSGLNGTYFLSFDMPAFKEAEEKQIFFISGTKKRKIGGEILGLGCNQFIALKSVAIETLIDKGIAVNTTEDRHLNVIAGSFIFVAKNAKQVHLAQVTLKDSKKQTLFCE